MPDVVLSPYSDLASAVHAVISTHETAKNMISSHAEKEHERLEGLRAKAEMDQKIQDGATRNAIQV